MVVCGGGGGGGRKTMNRIYKVAEKNLQRKPADPLEQAPAIHEELTLELLRAQQVCDQVGLLEREHHAPGVVDEAPGLGREQGRRHVEPPRLPHHRGLAEFFQKRFKQCFF